MATDATDVKACCAALYQNDYVRTLLGDSFHPGGAGLTKELGTALGLSGGDRVLDVASGKGTSAFVLADAFGCRVTGVDYGDRNVEEANARGHALCQFRQGDAEQLPFEAATFDAVISECAFCTFQSKRTAAAEMFRVLKPGGRLGLTDMTLFAERIPEALDNLLSIVACIGDARPAAEYRRILGEAGFEGFVEADQSKHLLEMVNDIKKKINLARFAVAINKLDLGGMDLNAARETALLAKKTIEAGAAGYVLLTGKKPG
ncbi:MAG TPA: methyltransferase domain-containing protein [Chloroflexota bacterium]|jgi:ubiquinone/menaquinone biosynthesis C-methylase UbiE